MPQISPLPVQGHSPISASPTTTVCIGRDHLNKKRVIVLEDTSGTDSPSSFQNSAFTPDPTSATTHGHVVAGMNFILSLEGPCLDHVRDTLGVPDAETGHGHALTLTASVFRLYEDSSVPPAEDQLLSVSRQTFQRLLELSSQLPTVDELTPNQIWAFLCQSGWIGSAQPEQVRSIAEELLEYIKCHGYGAVIPKEVVMRVISNVVDREWQ
ncbi:hypothetical protein BDV12DRAFT_160391 [Aspergillus spectabilis]